MAVDYSRYRFAVPSKDAQVNEWINLQTNLGFSLRIIIKEAIRDHGMQDVTCMDLGMDVKKKGRPSKKMDNYLNQIGNEQASEDFNVDDFFEEAGLVEDAQPVLQSSKPVTSSAPVSASVDIMSMLGAKGQRVEQTQVEQQDDSSDDGFIDPDDIL